MMMMTMRAPRLIVTLRFISCPLFGCGAPVTKRGAKRFRRSPARWTMKPVGSPDCGRAQPGRLESVLAHQVESTLIRRYPNFVDGPAPITLPSVGNVQNLNIALTEELANDIEAAVASGDYSTANEVVGDALRLWKRDREACIRRLRQLVEEGLASGEPREGGFDVADIIERGQARLAAQRQAPAEAGGAIARSPKT